MVQRLLNSVVFRIGAMLLIIGIVSIVSMFSSVYISEMADKDALAINHAGSMRMQSYRILSEVAMLAQDENRHPSQVVKLKGSLQTFDDKLNAPILNQPQLLQVNSELAELFEQIQSRWQNELFPAIDAFATDNQPLNTEQLAVLEHQIAEYVELIDGMVLLYQKHAESRITNIRLIQGIALFATIVLVSFTLFQLNIRVEKPLSELTTAARQIMAGDYTAHTDIRQRDELGLLSSTMNRMSKAISQSHSHLERRVKEKTSELHKSNDSLQLLYQIAQLINHAKDTFELDVIVTSLSKITGIQDIDLCLMTTQGKAPYDHITSMQKELPDKCIEGDCNSCISAGPNCDVGKEKTEIKYPLVKEDHNYGVLVCHVDKNSSLESWQHQLFSSVADQVATGLSMREQQDQMRRISLLTERNTIARELHDSLAQALSYLKIQVTRLQKLRNQEGKEAQIDEVVMELKNGLSAAYRELRELLTTFRLRIDSEGLEQTFVQTVSQLNERAAGKMAFELHYQIGTQPLTPNEEIHVMQIAREATQNALNHSKADRVDIRTFVDENSQIHLQIVDDGIGMPDDPSKLNHYGLAIMQERASHLDGEISITNNEKGGTCVSLVFLPDYAKGQRAVAV